MSNPYVPLTHSSVMAQSKHETYGNAESDGCVVGKPYDPPLSRNPVAVIGQRFCAPYPVDLVIVRKVLSMTDGNFTVRDINGNIVFKIKEKFMSFRRRRVLLDAAGNPLVSLQQKIWSARNRWKVFGGDSKDSKDLLFSAKRSSIFQFKTKLNVYLATNIMEELCDFKVKGSWFDRSCTIYNGNSNNIVAQMHKKLSAASVLLGKDTFMVTVQPSVDYAFIVALIVILDAINQDSAD